MKTRIFFDMDGVLATWNADATIEEVASPGYFSTREPMENVCECCNYLCQNKNVIVYILSSVFNDSHSVKEKIIWAMKHTSITVEHMIFVPYGSAKNTVLKDCYESDVLIDDYTHNLKEWHGKAIKLYNGINGTKGTWSSDSVIYSMPGQKMAESILSIALS